MNTFFIVNKNGEFEQAVKLNENFNSLQEILKKIEEKKTPELCSLLEAANKELNTMKKQITASNINSESVDAFLYLNQEIMKNREEKMKPGKEALK